MQEEPATADQPTKSASVPTASTIILEFQARIRSIRRCANDYVPAAEKVSTEWVRDFSKKLVEVGEGNKEVLVNFVAKYIVLEEFHYHVVRPHSQILSESLFTHSFSAFDAFLRLLLQTLYRSNTSLIFKVENKSIDLSELIDCASIDAAIDKVIERDISNLLRESYDKQFSQLASRHGVETLKKFKNWPRFIETAQRRNLVTHCDGVINSQYTSTCQAAGFQFGDAPAIGTKLSVDSDYLKSALDLLYEVGVKLGIVLWRTCIPGDAEESERFLGNLLFDILGKEEWALGVTLGEFAHTLPQKKSELASKISHINYAQALKWSGDSSAALKLLEGDWSASIRDLRLGVEVLRGNYDNAAKLMRDIGRKGELVDEQGYRKWPVFREFRASEEFVRVFHEIYGKEFAESTKDDVDNCNSADVEFVETRISESPPGETNMPVEWPIDDNSAEDCTDDASEGGR